MLNNYNTLENANLYEKQFLKRVGDLPCGTPIYALNNENEVAQYVIENKTGSTERLYSPRSYAKWCNEITINGEVFTFDEGLDGLMKAREFFADKTFSEKDSIETRRYISEPVNYMNDPNTIHFYFNVYPVNKKRNDNKN